VVPCLGTAEKSQCPEQVSRLGWYVIRILQVASGEGSDSM